MDTLVFLNDTITNNLNIVKDTIVLKVITKNVNPSNFFKMDNPLWYILTLLFGTLITYFISIRQKRNDSITEARKMLLNKRIEAHEKLLTIFTKGLITTDTTSTSNDTYYKIFTSSKEFNDWFNELFLYANENKVFFSKNVNLQLNLLNNFRKHIYDLITNSQLTDIQIKALSVKYYVEISTIFKKFEKVIANYFENEISLSYKYEKLEDQDNKRIQDELYKYSIISDHFKKGQII